MSIFKKIPKDNIITTPYTAHKKYTVRLLENSASVHGDDNQKDAGIYGYNSKHDHAFLKDAHVPITKHELVIRGNEFLDGTEDTTTNNFVQRSLHASLNHMYYRNAHNIDKSFCVEPTRNERRELNGQAQVISIPQRLFGDKIQESHKHRGTSIKITKDSLDIRDDGFGNLYDLSAGGLTDPLKVYQSTTGSLVGYWGFSEHFPYHQPHTSGHCPAFTNVIEDRSRYNTPTYGTSVFFNSASKHGTGIMLTGQQGNIYDKTKWSHIRIKKHPQLDFRKDEDFALSFWTHLPQSQSNTDGLFNYILTSGQGEHFDNDANQWHQSRYPFDVVSYNQTANVRERATLTFNRTMEQHARKSIRIRNEATHSFQTASLAYNILGSAGCYNIHLEAQPHSTGINTGHHVGSASFYIGNGTGEVQFVFTGSAHIQTPKNTANTIFMPSSSTSYTQAWQLFVEHFNVSRSLNQYASRIGAMKAFYIGQSADHVQINSVDPTGSAGNQYYFKSGSQSQGAPFYLRGGVGAGNPENPIKHGPSQSAWFNLTDTLGTYVRFPVTTESGDFTKQATYPTISFHGAITASGLTMASQAAARINQSWELGYTTTENTHPLLISASYGEPLDEAGSPVYKLYSAQIYLSQSIPGTQGNVGQLVSQGPGHAWTYNSTFHSAGSSTFSGGTGKNLPNTHYTKSFFVVTSRHGPNTFAGETAFNTASFHRHLFYWTSASSAIPETGSEFATIHSTPGESVTAIDIGSSSVYPNNGAFRGGTYTYYNIASQSAVIIDNHPSFSVNQQNFDVPWKTKVYTEETSNQFNVPKFQWTNSPVIPSPTGISFNITANSDGITPNATSSTITPGPLFGPLASTTTMSVSTTEGTKGMTGQILARRHDGTRTYEVSSSTMVTGSWNHVIFQKSGSKLELYLNNVKECEVENIDDGNPKSNTDILTFGVATKMTWSGEYMNNDAGDYFIDKDGKKKKKMVREYMRPISGAFDEFRIHDIFLNSDQRDLLYNCPNGTPFVGNAFYEHGILAITHPSVSYSDISTACTLSFKNTYEIMEHEYTLDVKAGEFNFTMNPSIIEKTATGSRESKVAKFVTDTDWDPYISTVGLYNDAGQLLVIGKFSKPLRKEDGYDTTIVLRYDT